MAHDEVSIDQRPLPVATDVTEAFYAFLRQGILSAQQCGHCGVWQLPLRDCGHFCDECGKAALVWTPVSGRGLVYSYIILHQRYHPAFGSELPYNVAIVQLKEGPRLTSRLDMPVSQIAVGMQVEATLKEADDGLKLPYFHEVARPGEDNL